MNWLNYFSNGHVHVLYGLFSQGTMEKPLEKKRVLTLGIWGGSRGRQLLSFVLKDGWDHNNNNANTS